MSENVKGTFTLLSGTFAVVVISATNCTIIPPVAAIVDIRCILYSKKLSLFWYDYNPHHCESVSIPGCVILFLFYG